MNPDTQYHYKPVDYGSHLNKNIDEEGSPKSEKKGRGRDKSVQHAEPNCLFNMLRCCVSNPTKTKIGPASPDVEKMASKEDVAKLKEWFFVEKIVNTQSGQEYGSHMRLLARTITPELMKNIEESLPADLAHVLAIVHLDPKVASPIRTQEDRMRDYKYAEQALANRGAGAKDFEKASIVLEGESVYVGSQDTGSKWEAISSDDIDKLKFLLNSEIFDDFSKFVRTYQQLNLHPESVVACMNAQALILKIGEEEVNNLFKKLYLKKSNLTQDEYNKLLLFAPKYIE